jgi:hypothetical protein
VPFKNSDPVSGCEQLKAATVRARKLLALKRPSHIGRWELVSAQWALTVLLHAATWGGVGMSQVRTWMNDPDAAEEQIQRFLSRSPEPDGKFLIRNCVMGTFAPAHMAGTTFVPTHTAVSVTICLALDAYESTCQ